MNYPRIIVGHKSKPIVTKLTENWHLKKPACIFLTSFRKYLLICVYVMCLQLVLWRKSVCFSLQHQGSNKQKRKCLPKTWSTVPIKTSGCPSHMIIITCVCCHDVSWFTLIVLEFENHTHTQRVFEPLAAGY